MAIFNTQLLIGFILAILIASISYWLGFLSGSGALAACGLGTVVFGLGGLSWAVVLMGFFISSSVLSKLFKKTKLSFEEKFSKSSRRDLWQVWANGGVAGVFVIFHVVFPDQVWPWLAFCGSLAAANADTWATELGVLSKSKPVSLISGKPLEPGSSGGVSWLGTGSALIAAFMIAILTILFWPSNLTQLTESSTWLILVAISSAGLLGSLVDSFLGASVQAMFYCPHCEKETEKNPIHSCGRETSYYKGWKWMNNDWVNTFCALTGGVVMALSVIIK